MEKEKNNEEIENNEVKKRKPWYLIIGLTIAGIVLLLTSIATIIVINIPAQKNELVDGAVQIDNSFDSKDYGILSDDKKSSISKIDVSKLLILANKNPEKLEDIGFEKTDGLLGDYLYKMESDYTGPDNIKIGIDLKEKEVTFYHGAYIDLFKKSGVSCGMQVGEMELLECDEANYLGTPDTGFYSYSPYERIFDDFYNKLLYKYIDFYDGNGDLIKIK